eukprot:gene307-6721_t
MKAKKRKEKRLKKASQVFPRPLQNLKPLIRLSNLKSNNRTRLGKGFTPAELKAAKLGVQFARSIGISVDERRRNVSEEGLQVNVQRLEEYKSKLILYPRRSVSDKKLKKYTEQGGLNDTPKDQRQNVTQQTGVLLPTTKAQPALELREITEQDKKAKDAWYQVRSARKDARAVSYQFKKKRAAKEAAPLKEKKQKK